MDLQNVGSEDDITARFSRRDPFPGVPFVDVRDGVFTCWAEVVAWLFLLAMTAGFLFMVLGLEVGYEPMWRLF